MKMKLPAERAANRHWGKQPMNPTPQTTRSLVKCTD